ncbi:MAG: two-component regulator propeller domain-containing protein, partial [Candidatus Cloacimonadota bacterium]|nr:two-component regulator propeller domain-containing protein [Candidatus Cloacimonadota bacterium]
MKKIILLFILIQFKVMFSLSDIKFRHLTTADGLTQNIITDILQDKEGYMWFGTRNGLNKFDGFRVTQYFHNEQDSTSLAANSEILLWNDSEGNMWVYTTNCFHKYIRETDNFKRYYHFSEKEKISFISIEEFYKKKISSQIIDVRNRPSVPVYNEEIDMFEEVAVTIPDHNTRFLYNLLDTDKTLWLFFGLNDNKSSIIKYHPNTGQEKFDYDFLFNSLYVTDDNVGNLLIGTWKNGIMKLNKQTGEVSTISYSKSKKNLNFKNDIIFKIITEDDGSYWFVALGKGLVHFDNENEELTLYSHKDGIKESLAHNAVGRLFKDNIGNIWVGSVAKGISYFNPNKSHIQHIKKSFSDETTLSNNSIYSLLEDSKGDLWIGTDGGGLNIYDPKIDEFTTYDMSTKNSLNSNTVISFLEDNNKDVWIGHWFQTLQKYDRKNDKIISFDGNDAPLCEETVVRKLFMDSSEKIWLAGEIRGVTTFDTNLNRFETILINNELVSNLIGLVYSITEDSEHNMIFGGNSGIMKYYPLTGESELLFKENQGYFIWSLFADEQDNNIWVGTNGKGLKRLDSKTMTFNTPKFIDELSQNVVYGILQDNEKRLWISTSNGIFRINVDLEEIIRLDVSEGLQDNDFNQGAFAKLVSGEMMFGGHNGFNIIDSKTYKITESKAEILITEFLVDGKKSFPKNNKITIPYDKNNIQIEFTNIDFINSAKTIFRYKLENFDDNWFEADYQRRYARYTNIPAGKYTFIISVVNNNQAQNCCTKKIEIIILKPFWQEWWFLIISILILIGIGYLILKIKTQIILSRSKKLEEQVENKTLELKKKNEELEAIFNNAIAGIIISDFNFNINYANNYFKNIVLKDGNSYSNEKIIEFVHPDD